MNIALITANYGGYMEPQPLPHGLDVPDFVVTDGPLCTVPGWVTLPCVPRPGLHPRKMSRLPKLAPFSFLPSGYDAAVWIDASITLTDPEFPIWAVEHLGSNKHLAAARHPDRDCIYTEVEAAAGLTKLAYDAETMRAQVDTYQKASHHKHAGLWAMTVLAWRNSLVTESLGLDVWRQVFQWSDLDQLALPFVLPHYEGVLADLPLNITNNPYFIWKNRTDQ